jgi:catechol 2,3-dioxygenase-like lactoylglutathione lyase family enzyme
MRLVAPLEVGITVVDLARMRAFYEEVLGLEFVSVYDVPPALGAAAAMCDHGYRIVRLQLSTGERIKLAQPMRAPEEPAPAAAVLARRGPAFLTFIVEDLDAMLADLRVHGVPVRTGEEKVEVRDGVFLAFAEDPEHNFLEFVEYADVRAYRPDFHSGGRQVELRDRDSPGGAPA